MIQLGRIRMKFLVKAIASSFNRNSWHLRQGRANPFICGLLCVGAAFMLRASSYDYKWQLVAAGGSMGASMLCKGLFTALECICF